MYELTDLQKVKIILEKVKELHLTSYDISKKTTLSVAGIDKILNGTTKKPQEKTLNKILLFIESKNLSSGLNIVNEPLTKYKAIEKDDLRALYDSQSEVNRLTKEIIKMQNILRSNKIDFKDVFEDE